MSFFAVLFCAAFFATSNIYINIYNNLTINNFFLLIVKSTQRLIFSDIKHRN